MKKQVIALGICIILLIVLCASLACLLSQAEIVNSESIGKEKIYMEFVSGSNLTTIPSEKVQQTNGSVKVSVYVINPEIPE